MTMHECRMSHFFEELGKDPVLYSILIKLKLKSFRKKSSLEQPDNFREFVSCWIFVHCCIINAFSESIEQPELKNQVQQKVFEKLSMVCWDKESITGILKEFVKEFQTGEELSDPDFSFSTGAMLSWCYYKRLLVLFRLKHYKPSLSELPSRAELAMIARITDNQIQMKLQLLNDMLNV